MKKLLLVTLMLFLSGCSVLDGGNYEKNREGYVQTDDVLIEYHTNSIGELDIFAIDIVVAFYDALSKAAIDYNQLSSNDVLSSIVTEEELLECGITEVNRLPRFIRLDSDSFYFKTSENGLCTYNLYDFHKNGFEVEPGQSVSNYSPINGLGTIQFEDSNFTINSFEHVLFIENIEYKAIDQEWERNIVTPVPMSVRQEGLIYEDNTDLYLELAILEGYILENQSINLLELRDNYMDEDIYNIWSERTIELLGRDNEVVKNVKTKKAQDILQAIDDTLSIIGVF